MIEVFSGQQTLSTIADFRKISNIEYVEGVKMTVGSQVFFISGAPALTDYVRNKLRPNQFDHVTDFCPFPNDAGYLSIDNGTDIDITSIAALAVAGDYFDEVHAITLQNGNYYDELIKKFQTGSIPTRQEQAGTYIDQLNHHCPDLSKITKHQLYVNPASISDIVVMDNEFDEFYVTVCIDNHKLIAAFFDYYDKAVEYKNTLKKLFTVK